MKIFLKIILGIIVAAYFLVIASVTVCLLCYNDYKVTEIAGNSLIIIDKQSDKYKDGDLVVFKKPNLKNIKVGSEVFFYEVTNGIPSINYGNVTNIEQINEEESTLTINDNHTISSQSLIGSTDYATVYPKIGSILSVLESRFGFLILVILPTLILFLYEIYRVIIEIKTPLEDEWKNFY